MVFAWFKRRRIERLTAAGVVVSAEALVQETTPRPRRLVDTDLGYGREIWADYGDTTYFIKKGRTVRDGRLVLELDDPEALAARLKIPLQIVLVKF